MKHRNILLAGLLAVVLVTGLAWLILRTREPIYQGKRLSEWLDGNDGLGAEDAVRQTGTNAIPTLLRMLRAHDSRFKLDLVGLVQLQSLIKIHYIAAEKQNREAAAAFYLLGSAASNAVPALIKIYERQISESSETATAESLHYIGAATTSAAPALRRIVPNTNADAHVRWDAAGMLAQLRADPKLTVPVFIKCLKDSEPMVRAKSASALASFGSDARAAVPALIVSLKDPDGNVRDFAVLALKAIDPEAAAKAGIK